MSIVRRGTRVTFAVLILLMMLESVTGVARSQASQGAPDSGAPKKPSSKGAAPNSASQPARDPIITQAMQEVSAAQIQQTIAKLASFGTRHTLSVNSPDAAKSDQGIVAARKWIKSEFERYSAACGGCLEVQTDTFIQQPTNRIPAPTELQNVYAILRGTDPAQAKRIYLVTGHYDSRNKDALNPTNPAPGANDDGSGTAVSLECARVLSKHKFPATLIFLTVAGEEQGLNGSTHFAKMAKEQGWQLEGVLNNDIVGGNRTPSETTQNSNVVRVFSEGLPAAASEADVRRIRSVGGENDSTSRELARYVQEVGATYNFGKFAPELIFRRDRYLRGGDHSAFNEQGFAAVRFTEYREDFHHQHENPRTENGIEYGDLLKFVDFDYVANVARLNAATLASLASAPAPPGKIRLSTAGLENDSKLQWEPAAAATAYEVLWRKTTDATFPAENTTRTTETKVDLDESKDNVIFGVRSIGAQGHRSLIVIPEPERGGPPAAER
jgi:Peptidase family M28